MFCKQCGNEIPDAAAICMKCGVAIGNAPTLGLGCSIKSRTTYIVLGIFLGALGIHNFYAGYSGRAISQLLITLLIGWLIIPLIAVQIWVLIDLCTITQDAQGNRFS